ncbi:hypothetical protein [Moorena sp. SIO3I6]|nr:hypothetical protein [Moorena sp. SIO3I6]
MSSKIDKSLLNNTAALGSRESGVGSGATRGEFNYGSSASPGSRESGVAL